MATLINNAGVQHYANKMVLAENRKVGSKSLPTALTDIDNLIDEMKTHFDAEYGSALDMKLDNNENVFSVGTGTNIDKKSEVENSFTDVELSGNSVVNLINFKDKTYTPNNNIFSVLSHDLKLNTIYTIIVIVTNNTLDTPVRFSSYSLGGGRGGSRMEGTTITGDMDIISPKATGVFVGSIGYKQFGSSNKTVTLFSQNATTGSYTASAMLIEGDWTNKPIPQYFEGLKSAGEKEDGNHKISILSRGKNLLDIKTPKKISEGATITDNGLKINSSSNYANTIYDLNLKIGAKYKVSAFKDYGAELSIRDMTGYSHVYFEPQSGFCSDNFTFEEGMTLRLGNRTILNTTLEIANIQIEEIVEYLDESTSYESYKEDKKEISLNEPLRGLPNGTRDTIEKVNGEWKIVRRCVEVTLNGSETSWNRNTDFNGTEVLFFFINTRSNTSVPEGAVKTNGNMVHLQCDSFPCYPLKDRVNNKNNNIEGIIYSDSSNPLIQFHVNKSKLASEDVNGFKEWLSQNPTKVVYELVTPIIEDISPVTLQCWKNGTISIDEVLPVETTHTVALNKPAQIKRNIEELTALRKRVQALEDFYDQVALEQAHQLSLINHSIELDYDI